MFFPSNNVLTNESSIIQFRQVKTDLNAEIMSMNQAIAKRVKEVRQSSRREIDSILADQNQIKAAISENVSGIRALAEFLVKKRTFLFFVSGSVLLIALVFSFFTVRCAKEDVYWISETPDDKHLRAFFGVVKETSNNSMNRFHVITTVFYKHWTGPVYFNLIRPFHHLVVSRMARHGYALA